MQSGGFSSRGQSGLETCKERLPAQQPVHLPASLQTRSSQADRHQRLCSETSNVDCAGSADALRLPWPPLACSRLAAAAAADCLVTAPLTHARLRVARLRQVSQDQTVCCPGAGSPASFWAVSATHFSRIPCETTCRAQPPACSAVTCRRPPSFYAPSSLWLRCGAPKLARHV